MTDRPKGIVEIAEADNLNMLRVGIHVEAGAGKTAERLEVYVSPDEADALAKRLQWHAANVRRLRHFFATVDVEGA